MLDLDSSKAPRFVENKGIDIQTIRKELTQSGLLQVQNHYSQKFEVLQKEHKKEFEAYLTKQFKHPE